MDGEPRTALLLDNCSAHPNEDKLISMDGKVIAKFLALNLTFLIQPRDQRCAGSYQVPLLTKYPRGFGSSL